MRSYVRSRLLGNEMHKKSEQAREGIALSLENEEEHPCAADFVGVQRIQV